MLRSPLLLVLASALPILLYRHPPLMDVPNHLARIWLEAQPGLTGILGQAYAIEWSRASSNILVDLVGMQVTRLFGLDAFWLLVTVLMVLGPPLAAILISRRLNGRDNPWQALALSAAWGQSTISGFMNYSLSLALALFFCLLNLGPARTLGFKARSLLKSVEVLAVYLTHPFGVGLFFAFEFAMLLGPDVDGIRRLTARRIAAALAEYALVVALTLVYIAVNRGNSPLEIDPVDYRGFMSHIVSLVSPFFAYDGAVELPLFAVIALCVAIAALRGAVAFHAGLFVSVVILGVLSLLIPDGIGNASLLTRRLPLMAALLICIAVRPRGTGSFGTGSVGTGPVGTGPVRIGHRLAMVCGLAILAHAVWILHVWRAREHDYADLQQAARLIPANSKVLSVVRQPDAAPNRWSEPGQWVHGFFIRSHLPTMLVPLSRSYVPSLFAIPGQQPLVFTEAFGPLQAQIANIPTDRDLAARTPPFPPDRYLDAWECDFDYVLMLRPSRRDRHVPVHGTRLVLESDFVDLMKVDRPPRCRS
ncbi:hypothetical protein [Novosphingobium soli]|uniref:Uncharacterized protein n=1 Tax=Novosphingobium soli TaxID=574956 RepID=A0ABV6CWI7_9SPHN